MACFPELRTADGRHWYSIAQRMPPALPGEASFAASGTCITTQGERNAWVATGGSTTARILATQDGGDTWNAYDTPLVSNGSAGGVSVAFRDPWNGIVGGGDLSTNTSADTATSYDGGVTWTLTAKPPVSGAIFCLAYVAGTRHSHDGKFSGGDDEDGISSAPWSSRREPSPISIQDQPPGHPTRAEPGFQYPVSAATGRLRSPTPGQDGLSVTMGEY